jgi:uncharacterized SAM-binding protein YcdF (DUF218 family)
MGLARRVYRAIIAAAFVLVLLCGGMAFDIWRFGQASSAEPADAALVLGAAVIGERPTPVLEERLRHAQELHDRGQVQRIVVTGGLSPEDDLTEAEASRRWLVARGVPDGDVVLEDQSRTTIENLAFGKAVLDANGIGSVLIVSDPIHMRRALMIADRVGVAAKPSPTPTTRYRSWQTQVPFLAKEVWFMAQYLVTGM